MRRYSWRRLAGALAVSAVLPAAGAAQLPHAARPLDVPYLSQPEALCGGAAAAMVQRFWGAREVQPEDFAPLLDARAGGIETIVLARALSTGEWRAHVISGSAASLQHHLSRGRPVIALIGVAPRRYHYVVVVALDERTVTYHDPAVRPGIVVARGDFERAWSAASRWALLVLPAERTAAVTANRPPPAAPPTACAPALSRAAMAATDRQFDQAETWLVLARQRCPSSSAPLRELAGLRLLQQRTADAVSSARQAVEIDPSDSHAWRVLGTALFLERDSPGALDAWNRAGDPVTDLVRVDGLTRTRHRVVTDRMGLEPGAMLTTAQLQRARRRVAALPAIAASRVDAIPAGGGLAEVEANVLDRALMPTAPLALAARGARAVITREITWQISSPTGAGERFDVGARWWDERPAIGGAMSLPLSWGKFGGVLRMSAEWSRETFQDLPPEDTRSAAVAISDWTGRGLRWESRVRADRWQEFPLLLGLGASAEQRLFRDRVALRAASDVWPAGEIAAASAGARWRTGSERPFQVLGAFNVAMTSANAPRALWMGVGTGLGRPWLLRAHPMLDDGVIIEGSLGRRVTHASVEVRRAVVRLGLLRVDLAGFLDAADIGKSDVSTRRQTDAGAGIRVRVPGEGAVRVDVARGLGDGATAVSVGWELPWPTWP